MRRTFFLLLSLSICMIPALARAKKHSYLVVWAGDDDKKASDFVAVIDADPASPDYGKVIASKPTGVAGARPHHTEDPLPASGHLLANGFDGNRTWLFDVIHPRKPEVLASFGSLDGYNYPHTYVRLPNGNVLATFQHRAGEETGGLVEFTERGKVIRSGSAAVTGDPGLQPYSVEALPKIDRAVSTDTSMMEYEKLPGGKVQLWRLSDLKLLKTFDLPPGPRGDENQHSGEARALWDGSVYVHTFHCGLYRLTKVASAPEARFAHGFEGKGCAVPIATGHWWLQTVPDVHAVEVLDISDPAKPKEVSRVTLDEKQRPHWIAMEPGGGRIVINSGEYGEHRLFIANFDQKTGALTLDEKFRDAGSDRPGVSMDGKTWPHGFNGNAYPHGTVFSEE